MFLIIAIGIILYILSLMIILGLCKASKKREEAFQEFFRNLDDKN